MAHHILMMSICALAAAACSGQVTPLPSAPEGVETFTRGDIEFSRVRAAGVPAASPARNYLGRPFGGGDWDFGIARTELTTSSWVQFLNSFGAVQVPEGHTWSAGIEHLLQGLGVGSGATFYERGPAGRPVWVIQAEGGSRPVPGADWYGGAAFCNWLHNDRRVSVDALLTGAYDLRTFDIRASETWTDIPREAAARYWLPTYDEWAVASFYDAAQDDPLSGGWWSHLNRRARAGIAGRPGEGETSAGWDAFPQHLLLPVAAYPTSQSAWGLLDTSGGLHEWVEDQFADTADRLFAGSTAGPYITPEMVSTESISWVGALSPIGSPGIGIRIATSEIPSAPSLACVVLAGVWASRRRRAG